MFIHPSDKSYLDEHSESKITNNIEEIEQRSISQANNYLETTKFDFFLKEIMKVISNKKPENIETSFNQILLSFLKGEHVYLKSFSYILKNNYNKVCFLNNLKNLWGQKLKSTKHVTANDFCQLTMLICNELPSNFLNEILKCYSGYKISNDNDLLAQEIEFDIMYRTFCILLYYSDYNETLRKTFRVLQQTKVLDPTQKIPKESLLRHMCEYSEDMEVNRINEILLLKEKSDHSGEKEISYAQFIQDMIKNDEMFLEITNQFTLVEKELQKFEKLKKLASSEN